MDRVSQILVDKTVNDFQLHKDFIDYCISGQFSFPIPPPLTQDYLDILDKYGLETIHGKPIIEILLCYRSYKLIEYYKSKHKLTFSRSPIYILTCENEKEENECIEIIKLLNLEKKVDSQLLPRPITNGYYKWLADNNLLHEQIEVFDIVQTCTSNIVSFVWSYKWVQMVMYPKLFPLFSWKKALFLLALQYVTSENTWNLSKDILPKTIIVGSSIYCKNWSILIMSPTIYETYLGIVKKISMNNNKMSIRFGLLLGFMRGLTTNSK